MIMFLFVGARDNGAIAAAAFVSPACLFIGEYKAGEMKPPCPQTTEALLTEQHGDGDLLVFSNPRLYQEDHLVSCLLQRSSVLHITIPKGSLPEKTKLTFRSPRSWARPVACN